MPSLAFWCDPEAICIIAQFKDHGKIASREVSAPGKVPDGAGHGRQCPGSQAS